MLFVRKTLDDQNKPVYSLRAYYESSQANRLNLKQYLTDHLPEKYKADKYNNYLVVFFMNIQGFSMKDDNNTKTSLGGYSSGKGADLLVFNIPFEPNHDATVSHEIYHSLDIPHTFNKLSENSLYVYKPQQTDNIMDYSNLDPTNKKKRSLFHWQWLIARKNIKK